MRLAATILIPAFALTITSTSALANRHGGDPNLGQETTGRGAAGDLQGGQGHGSAIPAMSSGGGAGGGAAGGGYGAGGARQSAEKILEIGKKAEENIAKGGEKFSSALEKLSSSFNSSLDKLKPAEDDKNIMKSLAEDTAKRKEASDGASAVGDEIVADIVGGTKARSDAWVETVKQQALAQQPVGPSAPAAPQYTQTVGDKIKQFTGGQGTRLGGNSLVRADQATNPSAQIPQMPGQHGGGGGNTFGVVGGRVVSDSTARGITLSGPVATNAAPIARGVSAGNFVENNFEVAQAPSGGFGNVVGPRAASVGALSADVPSPTISRSIASAEPDSREGVRGSAIYAADSDGGVASVGGARQASSPVEATQIQAIDGFIRSAGDSRGIASEEVEVKAKPKKKTPRGARQSLLKSRKN